MCTTCVSQPVTATPATPAMLQIPHTRLHAAEEMITRTLRWCARNGITQPTFTWGADTLVGFTVRWHNDQPCCVKYDADQRMQATEMASNWHMYGGTMHEVWTRGLTVDCASLLAIGHGARLLGVLVHKDGATLATVCKGEQLPAEVLQRHGQCDHCQCKRRRTETYVVQLAGHAAPCVVGRSCVRAYLGLEASRLAMAIELAGYWSNAEAGPTDEEPHGGKDRNPATQLISIVRASIAAMRVQGCYIKSSMPRCTSGAVWLQLNGPYLKSGAEGATEERALYHKLLAVAAADDVGAEAAACIAWAATAQGGDMALSMRSLALAGFSVARTHGIAVYMAAAYAKSQGADAFAAPAYEMPRPTEATVAVGARVQAVVRVTYVRSFETQYGTSWVAGGRSDAGWEWKCFTSSTKLVVWLELAQRQAEGIAIAGTCKGHEPHREHPNRTVMVLTRVKADA